MGRTTSAGASRHRSTRPQLAGRDAFEHALREIEQLPPKARRENVAAEYLPRFVAKLRELGYTQDDIVRTIAGMNLGVTERQIRGADSTWTKQHPKPASGGAAAARGAAGGGASGSGSGTPGAGIGAASERGAHAGLAGAGALKK
jgi:hypothetical protein